MQTMWQGFGIPADNCVWTDSFVPRSLRVTLSDAGIVTIVTLSPTAHAVNLYTNAAPIAYALDQNPGPLTAPVTDTLVDVTAFRPGGVLEPGGWQQFVNPSPGEAHTLHLVSETPYVTVVLVMLEEGI